MKIKIKRVHPDAKLPTRATDGSAAYDLYCDTPNDDREAFFIRLFPCQTGIAVEIPKGYVGLVCPRSGLATRKGYTIPNSPGIIDSDYRGEIKVVLRDRLGRYVRPRHGIRIAQLLVVPCVDIEWEEVDELTETERGTGGFGSTGE